VHQQNCRTAEKGGKRRSKQQSTCMGVSWRGERTVCAREVERRARALQRAARDDDALHAGRPAALQHGRKVGVVVALVTIHALYTSNVQGSGWRVPPCMPWTEAVEALQRTCASHRTGALPGVFAEHAYSVGGCTACCSTDTRRSCTWNISSVRLAPISAAPSHVLTWWALSHNCGD